MADLEEFTKRGRGSQLKGQRGENEVVAMVQPWWQIRESEALFVRTPKSGGWSVARVRGTFRAAGDIMTTSTEFPFCVEAKRREGWKLGTFAAGRLSPIWSWWRQAISAAVEEQAQPALFFRKSRQPWWILFPRDYMKQHTTIKPDIIWKDEPIDGKSKVIPDYGGVVPSCYLATRFFDEVSAVDLPMVRFP